MAPDGYVYHDLNRAVARLPLFQKDADFDAFERVLALALPLIEDAADGAAEGSVSYRHDPMDAIEDALHYGNFHEIILSTLPHSVSRWLHVDLPHRVAHLGLPLTTVIAKESAASAGPEDQAARSLA